MNPIRYATSAAPWVPGVTFYKEDCLKVLHSLPAESISSVVTDPPYGLADHSPAEVVQALTAWAQGDRERVPDGRGFMGNQWDRFVPPPAVWDECMRVLKPGGHMAVFAGSRTADLMGLSIRMAGFEMRDTITWMYSSGFPKSLDIGKAIDKAAGVAPTIVGPNPKAVQQTGQTNTAALNGPRNPNLYLTAPTTEAAKQYDGWGTALKPASEPIIVARKPIKGTVAANVMTHGTGGMNIDGCRAATTDNLNGGAYSSRDSRGAQPCFSGGILHNSLGEYTQPEGRWPANVVLSHAMTPDGFDACTDGCVDGCAVKVLDGQSGITKTSKPTKGVEYGAHKQNGINEIYGASRFYNVFRYQAKAPKSERPDVNGIKHPTVKPLTLMEWLVTLFTPSGGVVGDWFAGTGTTAHAALKLGFSSIIAENNPKYYPHIDQRLNKYLQAAAQRPSPQMPWMAS